MLGNELRISTRLNPREMRLLRSHQSSHRKRANVGLCQGPSFSRWSEEYNNSCNDHPTRRDVEKYGRVPMVNKQKRDHQRSEDVCESANSVRHACAEVSNFSRVTFRCVRIEECRERMNKHHEQKTKNYYHLGKVR